MRTATSLICLIGAIAVVAGAVFGTHRYMQGASVGAETLRGVYEYADSPSGKRIWTIFDLDVPSLVLGILAGVLLRRWRARYVFVAAIVMATVLVMLLPVYAMRSGPTALFWWPGSAEGVRGLLFTCWWQTGITVCGSVFAGRYCANYRLQRGA